MNKLLPALLGLSISLAASAQITTLIDLDGGTYTPTTLSGGAGSFTNSDFDRDGTADDSGKARSFAGSVTGSSYVMDGRGSVANLDSATQANWSDFRFTGGAGSNNSIAFRPTSVTDPSTSMAYSAWTSFESSGWLASTTGTGPSGLSLSMDVNNIIVDSTVRFFIKADGEEYVSSTSWTGDVTGATIADVSAESWYVLDAFDIDDLLANTSGSAVLGSTFTNITAVGVQTELVGFDGTVSSTSIGINVDSFVVTAVPEPSTYALLAGMATLGLVMFRRRRVRG
ncbi:MAG: PEP-CTERM sorting domain-containing protein [Oceanipulchritudo sp.]